MKYEIQDNSQDVVEKLGAPFSNLYILGADGIPPLFSKLILRYPQKAINVGIAEADLVGVAAGLALDDNIVIVGTISCFLLRRAYEQIRLDVCEPNLPVKLFGYGGGLSYGLCGVTHHMIDDITLLRTMPNMTIFIPSNTYELNQCIKAALEIRGPSYIRLGKQIKDISEVPIEDFLVGEPCVYKTGKDLLFLTMGGCFNNVLDATNELSTLGIDAGVITIHTYNPVNQDKLRELIEPASKIMVVEEHNKFGGLGDLVRELCLPNKQFVFLGLKSDYYSYGEIEYMKEIAGIDKRNIVVSALKLIET